MVVFVFYASQGVRETPEPFMKLIPLKRLLLAPLLAAVAVLGASASASANVPFSVAYSINTNGGFTQAANTSMTCDPTNEACLNALEGNGKSLNNNQYPGMYVDVDSDPTTFSSSSATLTLPPGAEVLYAMLAWGGDKKNASVGNIKMVSPGDSSYTSISADQEWSSSSNFAAWKDVTAAVQAAGEGVYTVANVQGANGQKDSYAGWQLIVAYRDSESPPRNITIFRGYQRIFQNSDVQVPLSGFQTPDSGEVKTDVGLFSFEGDLGLSGDRGYLNGQELIDRLNPQNNGFNSTAANKGTYRPGRDPSYKNTLGVDSDIFAADGVLGNDDTTARIRLVTSSDTYYVAQVAFATDLYAPEIHVQKSAQDLNGGDVLSGDTIRYTVETENTGVDGAINTLMTDTLPPGVTYVPGSMNVLSGPGSIGSLTDAVDSDAGFIAAGKPNIILGSAPQALLQPGQSSVVSFDVTVDAGHPTNFSIDNVARVTSNGQALTDAEFASSSNALLAVTDKPILLPDLAVELSPEDAVGTAGERIVFEAEVTNQGSDEATDSTASIDLGSGFSSLKATADNGAPCTTAAAIGEVECDLGSFAPGDEATVRVLATAADELTSTVTAETATPDAELALDNNSDSASLDVAAGITSLSVKVTPSKKALRPGATVALRVAARNTGLTRSKETYICLAVPKALIPVSLAGGTLDAGKICWQFGTVGSGDSRVVEPTFRVLRSARGTLRAPGIANATNAGKVAHRGEVAVVTASQPKPRPVTG